MSTHGNSKYMRRRRNALIMVAILALLLILVVIIVIKNTTNLFGGGSASASATPTSVASVIPTVNFGLVTPSPDNSGITTLPPSGSGTATAKPSSTSSGAGTTMYVTTDGVRLRSTASTTGDNIVSTLSKGTKLTVTSTEDSWSFVKLSSGKTGYISSSYLTKTPIATPTATAKTPTKAPATATPTAATKTSLVPAGLPKIVDDALKDAVSVNIYNDYLAKVTGVKRSDGSDDSYSIYQLVGVDSVYVGFTAKDSKAVVYSSWSAAYAAKS